jgi:hypothetical protein
VEFNRRLALKQEELIKICGVNLPRLPKKKNNRKIKKNIRLAPIKEEKKRIS